MGKKDEKISKNLFSGVHEAVQEKRDLGKYVEKEILTKLNDLALDYGTPGGRELMSRTDPDFTQRKRKLQQLLKDNLKREAKKLCDEERETQFKRGQILGASSASCVHNMTNSIIKSHKIIHLKSISSGSMLTSEDNLERLPDVSSVMDNAKDQYQSNRITSLLVGFTGSIHSSNPVTPEPMNLQKPESLHLEDSSSFTNFEEPRYDCRSLQSNRFGNFLGDQFKSMAVPVGHHFQADVLEWNGPSSEVSVTGDSDNSKWLGTKVWPLERKNVIATSRAVGKGRPSSCSCASPGSTTNCIRHHILEKRRLLKSDLGPLFHIWKFDEMGEEVSKLWTAKEQERFDLIAKRNSSSSNFIQNAIKSFPSKCKKDVTRYYFNVFIPRFMSYQTRTLPKEVDIDIDDVDDDYTLDIRSRKDICSSSRRSCKEVKSRYG